SIKAAGITRIAHETPHASIRQTRCAVPRNPGERAALVGTAVHATVIAGADAVAERGGEYHLTSAQGRGHDVVDLPPREGACSQHGPAPAAVGGAHDPEARAALEGKAARAAGSRK